MALITNLLTSILSRLIGEEVAAWTPKICSALISRAVVWLPENRRARFNEEWRSHIDEEPGTIGKLHAAVGLLLAARRMSLAWDRIDRADRWIQVMVQLGESHERARDMITAIAANEKLIRDKGVKQDIDRLEGVLNAGRERHDRIFESLRKLSEVQRTAPTSNLGALMLERLAFRRKVKFLEREFDTMRRQGAQMRAMSDEIIAMVSSRLGPE